jgi:hypothetical protein
MTRASLIAFVRSFSWKEWCAFSIIVAAHVWAGSDYGLFAMAFQLVLGLCVGLAIVGAWRILGKADRERRSAKTGDTSL